MNEERRSVELIADDGSILSGEFLIRDEVAGQPDRVELTLAWAGRAVTAMADDCFDAMILIRHELDVIGLSPLCWGASLQVYPSDSSRGQGVGDTAYKLKLGQFVRAADRVNIFDSGPGLVAATVAEQEDFSRAWFDSLADLA